MIPSGPSTSSPQARTTPAPGKNWPGTQTRCATARERYTQTVTAMEIERTETQTHSMEQLIDRIAPWKARCNLPQSFDRVHPVVGACAVLHDAVSILTQSFDRVQRGGRPTCCGPPN